MFSLSDLRRLGITGPVLTVVAAGTTLALLASCGTGGHGTCDEGVASIATPSTTAGKTAAPDAGHVRIRLDDNQEDVNRLWDAWTACLHAHGTSAGS
ncbi:hypothetical protein AB0I51_11865 [Streptomyces sp. NPDC050549]|uniref:hypothetical protein n=1 Tax=Streptomyces sp. NPDC050549 TaxID=3155406 RepID=UPI00342E1F03